MFRMVLDLSTGEQTRVDLTALEIEEAVALSAADDIRQERKLEAQMKQEAEDDELRALVNIDTGKSPKAKLYQERMAAKIA